MDSGSLYEVTSIKMVMDLEYMLPSCARQEVHDRSVPNHQRTATVHKAPPGKSSVEPRATTGNDTCNALKRAQLLSGPLDSPFRLPSA